MHIANLSAHCLQFPYQQPPVPLSEYYFKSLSSDPVDERSRESRYMRIRRGRGGRTILDRRQIGRLAFSGSEFLQLWLPKDDSSLEKKFDCDQMERLAERWKFDSGENIETHSEDCILFDDFNSK